MSLVTWSPFCEMENALDSYPSIGYSYLKNIGADNNELVVPSWVPGVDISEGKEAYNIKVELPGVLKKDVNITLNQGILTILGEKPAEEQADRSTTHRVECTYGQFFRSFSLPESVQEDKVEASYKDGVLNIRILKMPHAQPKSIKIN